jgi:hypothetical protein
MESGGELRTARWPATAVAAAIVVGLCLIAVTLLAMRVTGHDDGLFTRDVRAVAFDEGLDLPIYTGVISLLNNMVWAATAALALCAAALDQPRRRWHAGFGLLVLVFAADDSLMLHEGSGSRFVELSFYAVYAGVGLWLLLTANHELQGSSSLAFAVGSAFLAAASFADVNTHGKYLLEDGAKLIGALVWLTVPSISLASHAVSQRTADVLHDAQR